MPPLSLQCLQDHRNTVALSVADEAYFYSVGNVKIDQRVVKIIQGCHLVFFHAYDDITQYQPALQVAPRAAQPGALRGSRLKTSRTKHPKDAPLAVSSSAKRAPIVGRTTLP